MDKNTNYTHIIHPIPPLYDENSRILILGSLPSPKSREGMFFYHHPQNRYWRVVAAVCNEPVPTTVEEKRAFALRNHIAMWDVIESCDIIGASDSSIKNVKANDLSRIMDSAHILHIYTNGATAGKYYRKYILPILGIDCTVLPSTSPANAAYSPERLVAEWTRILV